MKMNKYSKELNLVLQFQQTKKDIFYEKLLKQYTPLLTKKANIINNWIMVNDNSISFDDIFADLCVCLLRAIKYVKLEKIINPEDFRLYGILATAIEFYSMNIGKKDKNMLISDIYYNYNTDLSENMYYAPDDPLDKVHNKEYSPEDYSFLYDHGDILQNFTNEILNPNEARVLSLFWEGHTKTEISKIFGCTQHNISYFISKLKTKLYRYLEKEAA